MEARWEQWQEELRPLQQPPDRLIDSLVRLGSHIKSGCLDFVHAARLGCVRFMPRAPRKIRPFPRIPIPRRHAVTRVEFDRVIQILNERGNILDDIRHNLDLQFRRIAQMQAQIDHLIARRAGHQKRS